MNTQDTETPAPETEIPASEDQRKRAQDFMGRMMSDLSRLNSQVSHLTRKNQADLEQVLERQEHLERCLGMLFEAMHIQMPPMTPRLVDARVELVAEEQMPDDETCELRASYNSVPHPVFGKIQIIVGVGEDAQTQNVNSLHPIIGQRIHEAFDAMIEQKTLIGGEFYFVRLGLIHARPINDTSVPFSPDEAAANDDVTENTDDQPE